MHRSPFALIALGAFSSVSSSYGFCTSNLLSSASLEKSLSRQRDRQVSQGDPQRRHFGTGIVLRHVATDPTIVSSQTDEDDGGSYDFISVKEAEEALQRERERYEGERSDLQWLLEVQRRQLEDLAAGRQPNAGNENRRRNASGPSSRIVILGAQARVDNRKNRRKAARNSAHKNDDRNSVDSNEGTYQRMGEMENKLQDALMENEKLTRQLREQQYQYNLERSMYEEELQEERARLNYVRDELHMERAYFETSRRMLQQLVEEEQQKVRQLEKELMMMISHQQGFSQENQSQTQYTQQVETQQQHAQQHAQQQRQQQRQRQSQVNNQNSRRASTQVGFTMNINDVHQPLYP